MGRKYVSEDSDIMLEVYATHGCEKCGQPGLLCFESHTSNGQRMRIDLKEPLCPDCIQLIFVEAEAK